METGQLLRLDPGLHSLNLQGLATSYRHRQGPRRQDPHSNRRAWRPRLMMIAANGRILPPLEHQLVPPLPPPYVRVFGPPLPPHCMCMSLDKSSHVGRD